MPRQTNLTHGTQEPFRYTESQNLKLSVGNPTLPRSSTLLNYPEAIKLVIGLTHKVAKDTHAINAIKAQVKDALNAYQFMPGVKALLKDIAVEINLSTGSATVMYHHLFDEGDSVVPGEIITKEGYIVINQGREKMTLSLTNLGDRPIRVGSHQHFFDVNRYLTRREPSVPPTPEQLALLNKRLNIPAGEMVTFEPGDTKDIELVTANFGIELPLKP